MTCKVVWFWWCWGDSIYSAAHFLQSGCLFVPTFCQTQIMQLIVMEDCFCALPWKDKQSTGWDTIKVEQKDLTSKKLLNLNLPHHKYLPESWGRPCHKIGNMVCSNTSGNAAKDDAWEVSRRELLQWHNTSKDSFHYRHPVWITAQSCWFAQGWQLFSNDKQPCAGRTITILEGKTPTINYSNSFIVSVS